MTEQAWLKDMATLLGSTAGMAQEMGNSAAEQIKSNTQNLATQMGLVTRTEHEALYGLVQQLSQENEALKARLAALEEAQKAPALVKPKKPTTKASAD